MNIRSANENDFLTFRKMAQDCKPLDVHTPYTYWVVCKFFGDGCFLLTDGDKIAGSIMTLQQGDAQFVWQIAIREEYRGKGYSDALYGAVEAYARSKGLAKILLSVDPANKTSFGAVSRFCEKRGLTIRTAGEVDIKIPEENCTEFEYLYEITL